MDDVLAEVPVTEPQSQAERKNSRSSLYDQLISPSSLKEGVSRELLKASGKMGMKIDERKLIVLCTEFRKNNFVYINEFSRGGGGGGGGNLHGTIAVRSPLIKRSCKSDIL